MIKNFLNATKDSQFLGQIFTDLDYPIIVLSPDHSIININDAALTLYNWLKKTTLHQNYYDLCEKNKAIPLIEKSALQNFIKSAHTVEINVMMFGQQEYQYSIYKNMRHKQLNNLLLIAHPNGHIATTNVTFKLPIIESVLSNIPSSIYWKDKDGVYLGVNEFTIKAMGYNKREEIIGKTDFELMSKQDAKKIRAVDKQILKSGQTNSVEESIVLPNGEHKIFLSTKTPLKDDADNIIGILGSSIDITTRANDVQALVEAKKQANQEAEEMSVYFENIIANIPGNVYWKKADGSYLGCNDIVAKIAGLKSRDEIINKTDYDLPWRSQADRLKEIDQWIVKTGQIRMFEEYAEIKDGEQKTYLSTKAPLRNKQGKIIGTLGISTDITKLKRIQAELRRARIEADAANVAKTEFISNMSHDIRTPLSGIIGMAQILETRTQNLQNKEFVQALIKSAKRLLRLLNEILEFSRIETGKQPVKFVEFNLREIIEDIADLMSAEARDRNIQLLVRYPDSIPQYLIGDRLRINRILLNLVGNSLKFTDTGHILMGVEVVKKLPNKIVLKLLVEDTGVGIPEDKMNFIFERFARLESSYKGGKEGVGLGLGIVKQFAEEVGGSIHVDSTLGEGSTFSCTIPFKLPTQAQLKAIEKRNLLQKQFDFDQNQATGIEAFNILLIEDDEVCQRVEEIMLKDMGNNVTLASTGQQALDKIPDPFDVIITDVGLPDIDGLELSSKIRAQKGPNQTTPIIALTAHVSDEYKEKCYQHGMNEVLHKPLDKVELIHVLQNLTRKKT